MIQQQEIQLGMEEKFQNMHNNCNSRPIDLMPVGIEGYDVISYDWKQIDLIIILFYVVQHNIINVQFEKENELEFQIKNKNGDWDNLLDKIILFDDGFNYCILSRHCRLHMLLHLQTYLILMTKI